MRNVSNKGTFAARQGKQYTEMEMKEQKVGF